MENTTEINGKEYLLTEGEGGKLTLTPLIKQPEVRTPEAGDVWASKGWILLSDQCGGTTALALPDHASVTAGHTEPDYEDYDTSTYLGKFSEVYVKISDVRDAFNLTWGHCGCAAQPNYNKLMDLNIITD